MKKHIANKHGITLMELLLSVSLLAIFGLFITEFLTTAWLSSEKNLSRAKCIIAAENMIELAGSMGIINTEESVTQTYARIIANQLDSAAPPLINVATWSQILPDSIIHPDMTGTYLAKIATDTTDTGSYTLYVGDAFLANVIEIHSFYATEPLTIDYNLSL